MADATHELDGPAAVPLPPALALLGAGLFGLHRRARAMPV
ncbi:MAG: PEP-CTERM sorting domain-containing protein [Pseudomonadota bacterium]